MERAKELQARGNDCYRGGRYAEARACYSQALAALDAHGDTAPEAATTASQLLANRAQTAIQERDFGAALVDVRLALERDPRNEKAVARQLIALENLERFEAALEVAERVLDGQPADADSDWRWTRGHAPALFEYCVAARRRLRRMLAKDREAAVKELDQVGKLVHDNQQLRINFGSLVPSQVSMDSAFDLSVNIGNEFGLFRRDMFQDGDCVALQCELYDPRSGNCASNSINSSSSSSSLRLDICLDSGVRGEHTNGDDRNTLRDSEPIILDKHGKAKFRAAITRGDAADRNASVASRVSIKVSVHASSADKWNLLPVVSLPIRLAATESATEPDGSAALGVHCCRPVRMSGLSRDILLAESPGSLGIGGKLWDSCLILTRYLSRHAELLAGKSVVELGSGLGLVGIYCSLLGAQATLTDMPDVVPLIEYNIALNFPSMSSQQTELPRRPKTLAHLWGSTDDHELLSSAPDVVVLSDVVYDPEGYAPLVASLEALARTPETLVLMAHRSRNPKEHQFFELLGRAFAFELVDWQHDQSATAVARSDAKARVSLEQTDPALLDVKIFRIVRQSGRARE